MQFHSYVSIIINIQLGDTSDAVLGFAKLLELKNNMGVAIRVTNNSWGGGGYDGSLKDASECSFLI